jgi:hypothetical protein
MRLDAEYSRPQQSSWIPAQTKALNSTRESLVKEVLSKGCHFAFGGEGLIEQSS